MATIQDFVANSAYGKIQGLVQKAFPSAQQVTPMHVEALILAIWNKCDPALVHKVLGTPPPDPTQLDAFNQAFALTFPSDGREYYLAHATHSRIVEPGKHSFTSHLPLVRVTLAATDANAPVQSTMLGDVDPKDHLFQSIEQVAFKLKNDLSQAPQRVDLVTPARSLGTRFGAIAVYVGYYDPAGAPSFYVLEAGTATGDTMVYYLSPDFQPIMNTRKWFAPTPFTNDQAYYWGNFVMNGDQPGELHVKAMNSNQETEVTVNVVYEKLAQPKYIFPALLTAEAAARVGVIAIAKGMLEFEEILAPLGEMLEWINRPA